MADNYSDKQSAPHQKDTMKSFGSFKIMLADVLTLATVIRLAILFLYPPRIIEELERREDRSHLMIRYMEERGQIQPTDITTLLNGLKTLELLGLESIVRKLFEDHTSVRCTDSSAISQTGEEKHDLFIGLLKSKYRILYDAVKPLPYVRDRMCCVDTIFIQGNIERKTKDKKGKETWGSVESYHDILSQSRNESTRCIILGDPGYGKSTLILQFLYDWCNHIQQSPLQEVDIVIFLRMRQLGGLTSIYQAIKQLLLPTDCSLTVDDIKTLLQKTNSTVIFFDGYDEYPDRSNKNTDFSEILQMKKLINTHVILTTRSANVRETPDELKTQSTQFKLTGFSETDQDKYIMKAVVGENVEDAKLIRDKLNENPVLGDLCQIPLFFTIVSHATHDKENIIPKTISVTWFFHFMFECFFKHTSNKYDIGDINSDTARNVLSKIAFKGLTKENQQLVWKKEFFVETVGLDKYNTLIRTGIVTEDEVTYVADRVGFSNFFQQLKTVSFYHKLFCESYAAFYLVDLIRSMTDNGSAISASNVGANSIWTNTTDLLSSLDQKDLQYLFRFASGVDHMAGCKIINYLVEKNAKHLAVLCILEFTGEDETIVDEVKTLCSEQLAINARDSKILQRAKVRVLEVASRCNIPISRVYLHRCSPRVSESGLTPQSGLILQSGLSLPILSSLQQLEIYDYDRSLTTEEFVAILGYSSQCTSLKELEFSSYQEIKSVPVESVPSSLKSRQVKVWRYGRDKAFNVYQRFNITSGRWQNCDKYGNLSGEEVHDVNTIRRLCSSMVDISDRESELVQRGTIQLLKNASDKDIPISNVCLYDCSPRVYESGLTPQSGLILQSGLSLSILSSLQRLVISDYKSLTTEEFVAILGYSSQCTSLKKLKFMGYHLPETTPTGRIPSALISRNVKVWNSGPNVRLNLLTGRLQDCDELGNLPGEEGFDRATYRVDLEDESMDEDDEAYYQQATSSSFPVSMDVDDGADD